MANLTFPQLSSGAVVQYPLQKSKVVRNITNYLPDGTVILQPDPGASRTVWQMSYEALSSSDVETLAECFSSCQGRLSAFTFIDPSDNMLQNSSNPTAAPWQAGSLLHWSSGATDPTLANNGFTVTNTGQGDAECVQTISVPANYQYCFSIYAQSSEPADLRLVRRGTQTEAVTQVRVGPEWTRLVSAGRLEDSSANFTVGIRLAAGQAIRVFGPQLEAQVTPSRYRATFSNSGVYSNAHWAVDELKFTADGPEQFSTKFSIEANR
jgi:hypothetical protein